MTRSFPRAALFAVLALAAAPHAFASDFDLDVHGSSHRITVSSYGDARAHLVVRGRGNQVDFLAGPCGNDVPSTTAMRGSGERHVLIAPCF